jgi:hypothetical protein
MADKQVSRRRRTKSGEAAPPPPDKKTSPKNKRYNLRNRNKKMPDTVRWVDDDTLFEEDDDDSTYHGEESEAESEAEAEENAQSITIPNGMPVSVKIHLHLNGEEDYDEDEDDEDEDGFDEDDEEEEDDEEIPESFITAMLARHLGTNARVGRGAPRFIVVGDDDEKKSGKNKEKEIPEPPIQLSRKELAYYEEMKKPARKAMLKKMYTIADLLDDSEMPYKFRILELNTTPKIQADLIRRIDTITRMGPESGEAQKMRNWIDGVMRIPFGKVIPLPVTIKDDATKCSDFLKNARTTMDKATYGMAPAKTQIMQILAQWISNPESVGNVIAMKGSMGVGKTSFARNGIAGVLQRPFMFFSLGGASDIAHYTGHSYTYEGSSWGRIIDAIMQAQCMNPVLYFDELDKISGTPHGEEITSMLIHLTDRSQNSQYHDRYFAGMDFDLSGCLFVFSFNDESKVHPVLKDRMRVITCPGYKDPEKKVIVANYVWPDVLKHAGIARDDLSATEEAAEHIIKEYSNGEEGMRNLIRVVETVVSRINLLRISDEESAKAYKFWIPVKFPMKLSVSEVKTLLTDFAPIAPEHWRSLYT